MSNIILFQFESNEIRFVGTVENPEWIAADVCKALDLDNVSVALDGLDADESGICNVKVRSDNGVEQDREMLTVTESGLYRLIFKSRKPAAKRMKKWVFSVVLPSIRKTGIYSITPQPQRQLAPQRDYIEHLQAAKEIALLNDPILKSYLLQACYEEIGASKALPPSDDVLVVAAVKARSLGFSLKPGEDSKLGKWVAKHCNPLGKTQHGRYEVNVYRDDDRLVETIGAFFG
jgi:prophage antirepressor-like protein